MAPTGLKVPSKVRRQLLSSLTKVRLGALARASNVRLPARAPKPKIVAVLARCSDASFHKILAGMTVPELLDGVKTFGFWPKKATRARLLETIRIHSSAVRRRRPARSRRAGAIKTVAASVALVSPVPAYGLRTLSFWISKLGTAGDPRSVEQRYENARVLMADWVNACRDIDATGFAASAFDVWLCQELKEGHYKSSMQLTFSSTSGLPDERFFAWLKHHPAYGGPDRRGQHPIRLGAFPELHVADGTIAHVWKPTEYFLAEASKEFRRFNSLDEGADDPYRQLAAGADMPADFTWIERDGAPAGDARYCILELVTNADSSKGIRVTIPPWVVSIADSADLQAQLEFANVGSVEELCDQATRLHFVRYVRPALRYYCEKLGHEIPAWLEDDATVTSLSDDEKQRLFGKPRFSLPTFKKVKMRASRGQVQREAE